MLRSLSKVTVFFDRKEKLSSNEIYRENEISFYFINLAVYQLLNDSQTRPNIFMCFRFSYN